MKHFVGFFLAGFLVDCKCLNFRHFRYPQVKPYKPFIEISELHLLSPVN